MPRGGVNLLLGFLFGEPKKKKKKKDKTYRSGEHRATTKKRKDRFDLFVTGKGEKKHCHYYYNKKTGESGMVHRGQCDSCSDKWSK